MAVLPFGEGLDEIRRGGGGAVGRLKEKAKSSTIFPAPLTILLEWQAATTRGNTVIIGKDRYVLQLIPCGILRRSSMR